MENKNVEIDIIDFFYKILFYGRKHKKKFVVIIILSLILSSLYYFKKEDVYENSLIFSSYDKNTIEALYSKFRSNNEYEFSNKLGIDAKKTKDIIEIKLDVLFDKAEIKPRTKYLYEIKARVKDTTIYDELQEALKLYCDNNIYLKNNLNFKKKQNNVLISEINKELIKIDSTNFGNKVQILINNRFDYRNGVMYLLEKKKNCEYENETLKIFEIVDGFGIPINKSTSFLTFSVIVLIFSLFFAMFVIFVLEVFKSKPNN